MQGTIQTPRAGYRWMRVGFAPGRTSTVAKLAALLIWIILGVWAYLELPGGPWRPAILLALYLVSILLYLNLGVWLHEQLHCIGFAGNIPQGRVHITYERKHLLILGGYYRVEGGINYRAMSRALLGPLMLSLGLLAAAGIGSLMLPGWWVPLLLSLVAASLLDMIHDLYMYSQIRAVGARGKYWDRGKVLEAVWKD